MSQSSIDPFALVNLSTTEAERKHRHTQQIIAQDFAERQFAYKQLTADRARSDKFYMNVQGRIDAAFAENFAKSMGEMTFGAMNADVRASRAANTPPLMMFDNADVMPNPQGNQVYESAGPGAADTPPGTIAPSAADRAAGPDTDDTDDTSDPVSASVTPVKPPPGTTTDPSGTTTPSPPPTRQQQAIDDVRSRGEVIASQTGPGHRPGVLPRGRMNINAIHVDPVSGEFFANVRGHMVPLNQAGWGIVKDWQTSQISAYNAETARQNAATRAFQAAAQDELLGELWHNANGALISAFGSEFPDSMHLIEGIDISKISPDELRRTLDHIGKSLRAGDPENAKLLAYEKSVEIWEAKTWEIREAIKQLEKEEKRLEDKWRRNEALNIRSEEKRTARAKISQELADIEARLKAKQEELGKIEKPTYGGGTKQPDMPPVRDIGKDQTSEYHTAWDQTMTGMAASGLGTRDKIFDLFNAAMAAGGTPVGMSDKQRHFVAEFSEVMRGMLEDAGYTAIDDDDIATYIWGKVLHNSPAGTPTQTVVVPQTNGGTTQVQPQSTGGGTYLLQPPPTSAPQTDVGPPINRNATVDIKPGSSFETLSPEQQAALVKQYTSVTGKPIPKTPQEDWDFSVWLSTTHDVALPVNQP